MQDLMFVSLKTMNKKCTAFHAIHPFYFSITDTHIEISNVLDDVLEKIEFMTMNVTHETNKFIAYNAKECISLEVKDNKIYKQGTKLPHETTKMYKISNEFCILGKNKNLYYKDITIEDVDDVFVKDDSIIVYKNKQLYRLKRELEILKFEENITLKNFYIINDNKFIVVDDTRIILTDGTRIFIDIDNNDADTNDVVIDQLGEYAIIANTMPGFTYINIQTDTQYEIEKPECNLKTDLDDDLEMVAAKTMCVCDNYIYILTAEKLYVYANRNEIPIDVIENVSIVDGQAAEASSPDTKLENASEVAPHSIKSMHEIESMLEKTDIEPVESIEQKDTAESIDDTKKDTKCDNQGDEKCEKEDNVKTETRAARAGFDKSDLASSSGKTKDDFLSGAEELHIPEPEIDEKDKKEIVNEHLAKYNNLKRTIKQETEDLINAFKQLKPCSYEHQEYEEIDSDYNTVLHNLYNRILDAKNGNLEKEMSYKLNLVEKYLSVLKDSNYNSTLDYFDKFIANIGNKSFYIPYLSVNEIISGIERINIKSDKRVDYLSEFLEKMSVDEEAVKNETEITKQNDRVDEKKEETINLNDTLLSDDGNRDFGFDKYEKKDNEVNASAHPFTSVLNYSTNQSKQQMNDGNIVEQRNEQVFGMSQTAINNPFLSNTSHTGLFNQSKMGNNPFTQNLLPNAGFQNSQSVFGTESNGQSINPFLNNPAPDNKKPGGSSALSKFANNHNRFI